MSIPRTTRVFNSQNESALDSEHGTPQATTPTGVNTGISARPQKASFSSQRFRAHRPSRVSNWRSIADEELLLSPSGGGSDKPPIPSALPQHGESHVSPLPILPMIVLSIVSRFNYLRVECAWKCVVGHAWRISLCKRIDPIPLIYGDIFSILFAFPIFNIKINWYLCICNVKDWTRHLTNWHKVAMEFTLFFETCTTKEGSHHCNKGLQQYYKCW